MMTVLGYGGGIHASTGMMIEVVELGMSEIAWAAGVRCLQQNKRIKKKVKKRGKHKEC